MKHKEAKNKTIFIVNYSKRPAHKKHISALEKFLKENNIKKCDFFTARNIYFQTTHPKNIIIMILAKIFHKNIIYYYHEPCFFKEKLKKRDGLLYSIAVKITQHMEFLLSNYIIVSNNFIKKKVKKIHKKSIHNKTLLIIPLIINEDEEKIEKSSHEIKEKDIDILFLGRAIPDHRYLNEFFELSKEFPELHFAILTKDNIDVPETIKTHSIGKVFSEDLRKMILDRTKIVWNPYKYNYNQSGVIPDALAHGCGLILSHYETDKELLKKVFVLKLPKNKLEWKQKIRKFLAQYSNEIQEQALNEFTRKYSSKSYKKLITILQ